MDSSSGTCCAWGGECAGVVGGRGGGGRKAGRGGGGFGVRGSVEGVEGRLGWDGIGVGQEEVNNVHLNAAGEWQMASVR